MIDTSFPFYEGGPSARAYDSGAGLVPSMTMFTGEGSEADRGGTILAANSAQQLAAANPSRRGLVFQNQSAGDLRLNFLGTATLDYHSLLVVAGAYFETSVLFCGTGAVSVIGAATSQAFYCREF